MNNEEYTRNAYLRALLGLQKREIGQMGALVNPAVAQSDDLSGLATVDTNFSGAGNQAPQQEKKASGFDQFMYNVLGFVDEMAAKFGSGFVGGWEGGLDLVATGLGALGWEDAAKWAKQDIGTAAAEWSKTAFGLGAWYDRFRNGRWDAEEWKDIGKSWLDWNQAAFFAKNDLGDQRAELTDKWYAGRDDLTTPVGQFLGGAAHSIGFMLPSIMTAGGAASAGAKELVQQGVSLGVMGAGAAGKGSEEAMTEGANAGKALGYGLASGAVEVASEIFVGKALGIVGLGTGKIAGVVGKGAGKTTAKTGSKAFLKELGKTMFEEGMEEVVSAVLEPVTQSIYKGEAAFKDEKGRNVYATGDFWFGSDGHFNESVLGQFTSGAFVGGLSGGVHEGAVYRKLGSKGYLAAKAFADLGEADVKMAKAEYQNKASGKAYDSMSDDRTKAMNDWLTAMDDFLSTATESQKKAFAELMTNQGTLDRWLKEDKNKEKDVNDFIRKTMDLYSHEFEVEVNGETKKVDVSHEGAIIERFLRENGFDTDFEIERGEPKKDKNGNKLVARLEGNTIYINENVLKTEGGVKIAHEHMAHKLLKTLSNQIKSKIYNQALKTEWYKENKDWLRDAYSEEMDRDIKIYKEEVFANYMEAMFNGKNVATQIENMRQVFGDSRGLFGALERLFRGAKKFKSPELVKLYAKEAKAMAKLFEKHKMYSAKDREEFTRVADALEEEAKRTKLQLKPQYSKAKTKTKENNAVDSQGNKLSEEQIEFFKDSKAVDDKGRLVPVYHSSEAFGFTVFDEQFNDKYKGETQHGFYFSDSKTVAQSYVEKEVKTQTVKEFADKVKKTFNMPVEDVIEEMSYFLSELEGNADDADIDMEEVNEFLDFFTDPNGIAKDTIGKWKLEADRVETGLEDEDAPDYWQYGRFVNTVSGEIINPKTFYQLIQEFEEKSMISKMVNKDNKTYSVYLNLKRPLIIDAGGDYWSEIRNPLAKLSDEEAISNSLQVIIETDEYWDKRWYATTIGNQRCHHFVGLKSYDDIPAIGMYRNGGSAFIAALDRISKYQEVQDYLKAQQEIKKAKNSGDKILEKEAVSKAREIFNKNKTSIRAYFKMLYTYFQAVEFVENNEYAKFRRESTRKITSDAYKKGYDGVIFQNVIDLGFDFDFDKESEISNVYVAFNSNQIKNVDNLNPTDNDDIRYSKGITGYWYIGDNRKQLKVQEHTGGGYEIVDGEHIYTEAVVGGQSVEDVHQEVSYFVAIKGNKEASKSFETEKEANEYAEKNGGTVSKKYSTRHYYTNKGGKTIEFNTAVDVRKYMNSIGAVRKVKQTLNNTLKPEDREKIVKLLDKVGIKINKDDYIKNSYDGKDGYRYIIKKVDGKWALSKKLITHLEGVGDPLVQDLKGELPNQEREKEIARAIANMKNVSLYKDFYAYNTNTGDIYEVKKPKLLSKKLYNVEITNPDTMKVEKKKGITAEELKKLRKENKKGTKVVSTVKAVYQFDYRGKRYEMPKTEIKSFFRNRGAIISNDRAHLESFQLYNHIEKVSKTGKIIDFAWRVDSDGKFEVLIPTKNGSGEINVKYYTQAQFEKLLSKYKDYKSRKSQKAKKSEPMKTRKQILEDVEKREKKLQKAKETKVKTNEEKVKTKVEKPSKSKEQELTERVNKNLNKALGIKTPKNAGLPTTLESRVEKVQEQQQQVKPTIQETIQQDIDEKLTKEKKNLKKVIFRDSKTTRNILDTSISHLQSLLGDEYKVRVPVNMTDFSDKIMSDINDVQDLNLQTERLLQKMLECQVQLKNEETGKYEYAGELGDFFDDLELDELRKSLKNFIEKSDYKKAKTAASRELEYRLEKAKAQIKEAKEGRSRVRVLTRQRDSLRRKIDNFAKMTGNDIIRNGLYELLTPFMQLHGSEADGFGAKGFADALNGLMAWYTEENLSENYKGLIYNQEIRNALEEIYDTLGYGVEKANGTTYKSLTRETMQKSIEAIRLIKDTINRMYENHKEKILPSAYQTIKSIKANGSGSSKNFLIKMLDMYKRGFAPSYVVMEEILGGNSEAARMLIVDIQNGVNSKALYVGEYHDKINKFLKEKNIKHTFDTKKVNVYGTEMSVDQAMGLYLSTKVQANYDAIDKDGIVIYERANNRWVDLAEKGKAEELKNAVESALPQDYKDFADYLLDLMNSSVKEEYIKWFSQHYGEYAMRNEIGEINENTYWSLNRYYNVANNLTKSVVNPAAIFKHSKNRTNGGNNQVLLTGALSTFDTYIDRLGRELYITDTYRDIIAVLNVKNKGGKSVMDILGNQVDGAKNIKYLNDTLADILGANMRQANIVDRMVSAFSVAKLSLNIGSMGKQFASAFTSNIPLRKTAKALLNEIFRNEDAKAEFDKLFNGVKKANGTWEIEPIGGLKYREANKGVLTANADSAGAFVQKVSKYGMIGISKVDLFTVSTGVYALMVIGQDQFNAKIGTQANIKFVKDHWYEYELSQIGNSALSKNYIARTPDSVVRYLFGFLQGANRAALGSQIHKWNLFRRNRNVNKRALQNSLNKAQEELNEIKNALELDPENQDLISKYVDKAAEVKDFDNRIRDFESFEIAGGKKIPTNMAAGILAQGILIALINTLMKRIKGRKDWDEWDIMEEGLAFLKALGVDWVPLVNFIANIMQGYEVDIPAINLFNQFSEIFKSANNKNWRALLRQCVMLAGDMTGVPVQTLYQYAYGTIKSFDPAIAWDMRSVLYGSSLQSATNTLKNYADKGNLGKTTSMVKVIMTNYKTGSTTDEINKEIASLYISGYNALPKSYMTQYTDDTGEVVKLTKQQITQFQNIYSQATKDVSELLKLTDYRNLTAEEKAAAIKKIYDAYYSAAKAVVLNRSGGSKLANLVAITGGDINVAKYVLALSKISTIVETSKKTRKELVLEYINKLRGYTKAEKTMLMYLAGYSVTGSSKNSLISMFMSYGLTRKEALELI